MATKGKSLLQRRENQTINSKLEQSQARVAGLLAKLEDRTGSFDSKEVACMQANITDLMGRFEDSATDMQHEIKDVLESFMKGTLTPEELQNMMMGEKERGAYATTMIEDINSQLENMFSFVANYLNDVERGKPLPSDSFKSLYQELDFTMDKIHSVKKVIHTPTNRVQDVLKMVEKADEERIKSRAESMAYIVPITAFNPTSSKHSWKNIPNFNDQIRRPSIKSPETLRRNNSSSRPSSREDPVYMDITGQKPAYTKRGTSLVSPTRRIQRPSQFQFDALSVGSDESAKLTTEEPNSTKNSQHTTGVASRRKSNSRATVVQISNMPHHSIQPSQGKQPLTEDTPIAPMKSSRIAIPSAQPSAQGVMSDNTITEISQDDISVGSNPSLHSRRPTPTRISRFNSDESNHTPSRDRSFDNGDEGSDSSPKHSIKRQWSTESQKGRIRRGSSMSGVAQVPADLASAGASMTATLALLAKEEKLLKIERDLKARSDALDAEVAQRVKAAIKEKKDKKLSPKGTPRKHLLRKDSRSQSKKIGQSPVASRKVLKPSSSSVSSTPAATPPRPRKKAPTQNTPPFAPSIESVAVQNIVSGILSFVTEEKSASDAGAVHIQNTSLPNTTRPNTSKAEEIAASEVLPEITDELTSRPNSPQKPPSSQQATRPNTTASTDSYNLASPPPAPIVHMLPINDSLDCETVEESKTCRSETKSGRGVKLPGLVIPTQPSQMAGFKRQSSGVSTEIPMSPLSVNSGVVPSLALEPRSNVAKLNSMLDGDEIWVPPPSYVPKKTPNTMLIFPLQTSNKGTMTDPPAPETHVESPEPPQATDSMKETSAEASVSTTTSVPPIPPEPTFEDYLRTGIKEAENPLLFLYDIFHPALPELHRVSFLQAVTMTIKDNTSSKNKSFGVLFESVYHDLQRVEYSIMNSLNVIQSCDESMRNVIVVLESKPEISTSFYDKIDPIAKSLGDIEVARSWVDMLLSGYRAIFTRISSLRVPSSVLGPYFDRSYQLFATCQGGSVNITNNLNVTRKKFDKYLAAPLAASRARASSPHKDHPKEHRRKGNLEELVSDLKEALHESQDEIDELKVDLFTAMSGVDRTPGALLFFAALHDPHLPQYLHQTVVNIDALRGAVSGKVQFDFQMIKRRLETAFLGLPSLHRFLQRYSALYQRWNEQRVKVFANRNILGSSTDNNSICPLCNVDSRKSDAAHSNNADDNYSVQSGRLNTKIAKKTKNTRKEVLGPVDKRLKETLLSMSSVKF